MLRRLWGDQRGSVSLVSVMLMVSTLLLMMILLDRDQVNYLIHAAEQDADFAAESATVNGAYQRTWGAKWLLRVDGLRYYMTTQKTCNKRAPTAPFDCIEDGPDEEVLASRPDTIQAWISDDQLRSDWKSALGCWLGNREHAAGDFVCSDASLQVRDWYVRYTPSVTAVAVSAFKANFADLGGAHIVSVRAEAFSGGRCPNSHYSEDVVDHNADAARTDQIRQVHVTAVIQAKSLFGLWSGPSRTVEGAALPLVPIPVFVRSVGDPGC